MVVIQASQFVLSSMVVVLFFLFSLFYIKVEAGFILSHWRETFVPPLWAADFDGNRFGEGQVHLGA